MITADYAYPFDPTGKQSSNAVVGEQQIISPPNDWKDYYFLIPKYAPFFRTGFKAVHKPSGKTLVEGVDFLFTHQFRAASKGVARPIFGSITFFDKSLAGVIVLNYQTIGGLWTQSETKIAQILANSQLNPRITTWDQIVDMPVSFPPIDHEYSVDDLIGMSAVVNKLDEIRAALSVADQSALAAHITDKNNPHQVTKTQVGLSAVMNYGIASTTQAQSGTANDVYMTPLRVKEAIDKFASGGLGDHINNKNNPHGVTKGQVQLGNVDNYVTATQAQAEAGTATDAFMTPLRVAQAIQKLAIPVLNTHIADKNNPHGVTKFHVGLGTVEDYPVATQAQAQAGTSAVTYMTPLRVAQAIEALISNAFRQHLADTDNPHEVSASQLGVYLRTETDALLQQKLTRTEQAYDSGMLGGRTLAQVMLDVYNSTVSNSEKLGGKTLAEIQTAVASVTAKDSDKLGGKTYSEVLAAASSAGDQSGKLAVSKRFSAGAQTGTTYTRLATVYLPASGEDVKLIANANLLLSGVDTVNDAASALLLVQVALRNSKTVVSTLNLNNVTPSVRLGYVTNTTTNVLEIWAEAKAQRLDWSVTELSKGRTLTDETWPIQTTEPTGITYVTANAKYWSSDNFDPSQKLGVTAQAADSKLLEGKTLAEIQDSQSSGGTVYNAKRLENKTLAQVLALAQAQKAADSSLLEGKTKAEVVAEALAGQAANSKLLEGKTLAQIKTEILSGSAANATNLNGQAASFYATQTDLAQLRTDLELLISNMSSSFQEASDDINSGDSA